jgi:hypothetical protein
MYRNPDLTDPTDRLAHWMSEMVNDNAPLGWEKYRVLAIAVAGKFDISEQVAALNL